MLKPDDQINLAPTLDTGGRQMEGDPYTLNFLTNLINNPIRLRKCVRLSTVQYGSTKLESVKLTGILKN